MRWKQKERKKKDSGRKEEWLDKKEEFSGSGKRNQRQREEISRGTTTESKRER